MGQYDDALVKAISGKGTDDLHKAHVKEHMRHTSTGKLVEVKEHDDARKAEEDHSGPKGGKWQSLAKEDRLKVGDVVRYHDGKSHVAMQVVGGQGRSVHGRVVHPDTHEITSNQHHVSPSWYDDYTHRDNLTHVFRKDKDD